MNRASTAKGSKQSTPAQTSFLPARKRLTIHHSERKILLFLTDLVLLNAMLIVTLYLLEDIADYRADYHLVLWMFVLSLLWTFIGPHFSIYNLRQAARKYHSMWRVGLAVLVTTFMFSFIPIITPRLPGRRIDLALFPLLALLAISVWRAFYAIVIVQPRFSHNVIVVGAGMSGRTLIETMSYFKSRNANSHHMIGYRLLGFVDDDPLKQGTHIEGYPVVGTSRDLVSLARECQVEEVVVATSYTPQIRNELYHAIFDCQQMGVMINTMTDVYEGLSGRVPIEHAAADLRTVLPLEKSAVQHIYLRLRRLFDVFFALVGLLFLLIVIPFLWLANRLTDPGDLFYRQERIGKDGQPFKLTKFRSMIMDAEKDTGAVWATDNDSRITQVGGFLRKTRLDETPQFWNILAGQMSLIGPRPERPEFVAQLSEELPFYRMRHSVAPGLTGWAQVNYPYSSTVEDAFVKLQFDLFYIKHTSLYLDLRILMSTVRNVVSLKGR